MGQIIQMHGDGIKDAAAIRQIVAEIMHGNAQFVQAMCEECITKRRTGEESDFSQIFFDAFSLGACTIIASFADKKLNINEIRQRIKMYR